MKNEILLGKTKKFGGRNETNVLQTELESTSKPLISKDLKTTVDLYEEYKKESSECTKYRLTLTVKPYCTNILFNMCTEIVKDEGSETIYQPISDNPNQTIPNINGRVYGMHNGADLNRQYMVSNTEYSSPEIGYTYLPGYDIFDNHTLRNLSFRPIMRAENSDTKMFNTLADVMRTRDGKTIKFYPRFSYGDIEGNESVNMHIYEHSNVLKFIDGSSANANLICENGWFGFINASSIDDDDDGNLYVNAQNEEHIFSHTLNNVENCGFIDMFPDRTRFSLVPKYNEFRHRYEKNWDIFLTYPWKNFYNHNLVKNVMSFSGTHVGDGEINALATMYAKRENLSANKKTMLFRTFTKHGLQNKDTVAVFLSKDNGRHYQRLPREYTVDYLGDINGLHEDYFFGISSKTFLNDIFYGEIEDKFYSLYTGQSIPADREEVSWHIEQVPENYSPKILAIYTYDSVSSIQHLDGTYDDMPSNVNQSSPREIRVWDKSYNYMMWDNANSQYALVNSQASQAEYGDWNTYSDTPSIYTFQYIRVKVYDFYSRHVQYYRTTNGIDVDSVINSIFKTYDWHIRFVKVVNGVDCSYYIRKFRKLPNFKYSSEPLSEGVCENEEKYLNFLKKNASDENGNMISFDSETYKLAFSKTLYGDDVAQVTFLDTVDISNLTDNLGRPVTEIYSTIVKRNKGYKVWYEHMSDGERLVSNEETEYSRCFGSLTTGFEYLDLDDLFDKNESGRRLKGFMSSVSVISRNDGVGYTSMTVEDWDDDNTEREITEQDDVFYGDVVEYNPSKCIETVLCDACFRFNTAQREIGRDVKGTDFNFTYHELRYDDFDPSDEKAGRIKPFLVTEYSQWTPSGTNDNDNGISYEQSDKVISVRKKEGYYYKPHTKIQLLSFSENVFQDSHRTLTIRDCIPLQLEGMYIKVTTRTVHGVNKGTQLYICVDNEWLQTTVADVIDNYRFVMNVINKNDINRNGGTYYDWVEVCNGVKLGTMKIRVQNNDIPSYANRIGENLFVWRDVVNYDDIPDSSNQKLPFSNGAFYVDKQISLYLKRQDPKGINGLYTGDFGEVDGKIRKESYNKYKNEEEMQC